jgi:hypothetical protein
MTKAAYGRYRREHFGTGSPAAVTKWIASGKITRPALTGTGDIAVAEADRQLAAVADPARVRSADLPPAEDSPPDAGEPIGDARYVDGKIALQRLELRRRTLDMDEREGRLINAGDVSTSQFDIARTVRDRFLTIPAKAPADLVGKDEREMSVILKRHIDETLKTLVAELTAGESNVAE